MAQKALAEVAKLITESSTGRIVEIDAPGQARLGPDAVRIHVKAIQDE